MTLRDGAGIVQSHKGLSLELGYTRLRVVLSGEQTNGAFALTEQPLEAGALAGPLHTHANEDGFIYVLAGRIGAQVGDDTVEVEQSGVVLVRRGVEHTFWNPTAEWAAVSEFFSPAGLERWFHELAGLVAAKEPDVQAIVASAHRHGTELDFDSIPGCWTGSGCICRACRCWDSMVRRAGRQGERLGGRRHQPGRRLGRGVGGERRRPRSSRDR